MTDYNKSAYHSKLRYERIGYNNPAYTIQGGGYGLIITHGFNRIRHVRVWGELYDNEFSLTFVSSAQYQFTPNYDSGGYFGYEIRVTPDDILIINWNNMDRRVYVRVYEDG